MTSQNRVAATAAERTSVWAAEVVDVGETQRLAARRRERLMGIGSASTRR